MCIANLWNKRSRTLPHIAVRNSPWTLRHSFRVSYARRNFSSAFWVPAPAWPCVGIGGFDQRYAGKQRCGVQHLETNEDNEKCCLTFPPTKQLQNQRRVNPPLITTKRPHLLRWNSDICRPSKDHPVVGGDLRTRGSKTIAFPTWLGIVHSIHLCHLWKGLCFLHCILSSCLLNLPDHRLIGNIPTFSSKVLRAQTQFCEVRRPNSLACGSTGSLAH